MRARVNVTAKNGDRYVFRLNREHRDMIRACVGLMADLRVPDEVLAVQVGCSRERLTTLWRYIGSIDADGPTELSLREAHIVHSALLSSIDCFRSEEDFHGHLGFYRDNVRRLGLALAEGVGGFESGDFDGV
ncbi:hypothetical protein [Stackebrandtia albiflava]|uniref:hypothetical protein n=1 Tax=Stackebrandtia albiflava TaxID=406432 RepID=UPI0011BDE6C2|nr:hypothetical protein [Stackebrandtia albiflava]